jgi:glycosyltransferase involved in cell wall biosynthesis
MRIGFDGGCLPNRRGFGRFARETLRALARARSPHQFAVILDRPSAEQIELPPGCEAIVANVREAPSRAASAQGRRRVGDMLAMGRAAARARLDLIFFPATYSFFPVWNVPRVVVTMHDTLALAHPELVFPSWKGRVSWTLKEHAAARWADRILTVSEASRRDLIAWFGFAPDRVRVVTEGPDAIFRQLDATVDSESVLTRYQINPQSRYLLYVGGLSPHKNLPRLIEAFASAAPADLQLVLVGDHADVFHTHVPALREAVTRLGLGSRVLFPGFVPDHDLVHFYNRAEALVQPSLMEGFGLPPVEAMACGTPVLYSRAGSLPEVVGDAGLSFDPNHVRAIAATIRTFFEGHNDRTTFAAKALARAQSFTWEKSVQAILACFDELDPNRALGRTA